MKHWLTTNYEEFGMMSSRAGRYRHPSHANTQPSAAFFFSSSLLLSSLLLCYITPPPPPPPPHPASLFLFLSFPNARWLAIIDRPGGYRETKTAAAAASSAAAQGFIKFHVA
jgi:hypothetical protein